MADPAYRGAHQRRRAAWVLHLSTIGPIQCGCRGQCRRHTGACPVVIEHGSEWHLGHGVPVRSGGDGTDSRPWCIACNLTDAANATNAPAVRASRTWG